jgi:NADH dehydrogenase FAD-containing subunit
MVTGIEREKSLEKVQMDVLTVFASTHKSNVTMKLVQNSPQLLQRLPHQQQQLHSQKDLEETMVTLEKRATEVCLELL